jgi:tetratricopeptide (TPR) repeat protein
LRVFELPSFGANDRLLKKVVKMCKSRIAASCLLACLVILCEQGFGEGGNQVSFSLAAAYFTPFDMAPSYFNPGAEVDFSVDYRLPVVDFLGVRADLNSAYLPIVSGDGCAFFSVAGGPSVFLPRLGGLASSLFGTVGYYYGVITDSQNHAGGNLCFSGGLRAGWQISPSFNAGAEVSYRFIASGLGDALYQGLSFAASARYTLLRSSPVRIREIKFNDVFPVFLKYYDTHSIGQVVFENSGTAPVKDLEVSLFVDKYMDNPTPCPAPPALNGGQKATIDLFALFSEKVLSITESTVVSGKVMVSYLQGNKRVSVERSASLHVQDRNALTWDDDRKIAAFVLYKDPAVLEIAKSLARIVKEEPPSLDGNLSTAMAVHESLRKYGMSYVVDPTSSYAEQSKSKVTVDYIQYPRASLQYKSGDCDDLSVLYAAILQGVGVDTAFITVPGHIYVAFSLAMSAEKARKLFSNPSSLIFRQDKAWVPLEITMTTKDFVTAWDEGSSEWKDNEKEARFIPVGEAWETFEPVGYFEDARPVTFVPDATVKSLLRDARATFIRRELDIQRVRMEKAAEKASSVAPLLNSFAVLCARYGQNDMAKQYLAQALQKGDYLPALINYGNVLYLEGDYSRALAYYQRAQRMKPDDAVVALHLAQAFSRLGNTDDAEGAYRRLAVLDPALAARHPDLATLSAGQARAAERGSDREEMLWQE